MKAIEPNMEELLELKKELYKDISSDENVKKIKALEVQIQRHRKCSP